MTIQELILIDKAKVRRDSNLMHLYLEFFKETFGYLPNCAGCSFSTDWQKFVSYHTVGSKKIVTLQKSKVMSAITIKKIKGEILSYRKDGRTYRRYDNILNDEFINEYFKHGTEEELAERKKMFNLPSVVTEEPKEVNESSTQSVIKKQRRKRK